MKINEKSEIKRKNIKDITKMILWGRAGGRCELCNRLLYSDLVFGELGNFGELAHIHAVSLNGPRNVQNMTPDEINDISNLMLLCEEHHHMIDSSPNDFESDFLIQQKKNHEARIQIVTEIADNQSCRIITYFSDIDNNEIVYSENVMKQAVIASNMPPLQYPVISLSKESITTYTSLSASIEAKSADLEKQVKIWFGEIVKAEDAVAIFALAPQPLLFKLGTLINDQTNAFVYQCHRSGHRWAWRKEESNIEKFNILKSHDKSTKTVALVIDLSAHIIDSRITDVLGDECTIYHITIDSPNRDFVTTSSVQVRFIESFRLVLEEIKNTYPMAECIHLFPAMPNSLVICAGMDYMFKSDLPITLYEQTKQSDGFFKTITIGG